MKNNYRKLKLRILFQALGVSLLTIIVGYVLTEYIFDDSSNGLVRMLTGINVNEETAKDWYWRFIGNHKGVFIVIGFLLLFSLFFYIALAKLEGYLRQIEVGINNITSDSKEPIHMIEELKPIETRLTEIKSTLKKQEREALEAEQKKNDLMVCLVHDLKTPLTSVMAYLTMLDSYKDMPAREREHYTHIALEKSARLNELVNEFFDIAKLNLQDIELDTRELNLSLMLEQVADEFYGVFMEKGLGCDLRIEDGLVTDGDADKLARVFDNILRNAVSYSYPDSVVGIQAGRSEDGIRIVFSNRGDRIPEDKLETIFEKFYRLDESRRSKTGGAGLGLAIAKRIVSLHNGSIRAESDTDSTRFIVTLPERREEIALRAAG